MLIAFFSTRFYLNYVLPSLNLMQCLEDSIDLRSASVHNECYAQAALKTGLHRLILHASQDLEKQIVSTALNIQKLNLVSKFGWESETTFPKVLQTCSQSWA